MASTFVVDDVKPIGKRTKGGYKHDPYEPFTAVSALAMFKVKLGKGFFDRGSYTYKHSYPAIEAHQSRSLVGPSNGLNPLIECLNHAYDHHLPVVLSPDVIWACIGQGLAAHIKGNAERVRHQFVQHEGKEHIKIQRDEFVKSSPDNDWPGCFNEFGRQLKGFIGDKYELFVSNFDTSGPVERAVSEITLMDAMSEYFSYGVRTCCGFPRFTLTGHQDDWKEIQARVRRFREIDPELAFWFDHLDPVLDELVKASDDRPDKNLWSNFYKVSGGSGGPFVSGWINTLFPYMARGVNPDLDWTRNVSRMMSGGNPADYPRGLSEVPVEWKYYDNTFDMKFVGGMIGTSENVDDDNALQPEFGWCVYDATAEPVVEVKEA